jgi:hypothetical protein
MSHKYFKELSLSLNRWIGKKKYIAEILSQVLGLWLRFKLQPPKREGRILILTLQQLLDEGYNG